MPYFTNQGRRLHYVVVGEGYPVMLVHGFTNAGLAWMHQIAALSYAGYQVIVPDLSGHGLSSHVASKTTVSDLTADIVALLDHLKVERTAICGLSLGGMVAQQAALDYADRISVAVVANSRATFSTPELVAAVQSWIALFAQPDGPLQRFRATWPNMLSVSFRESEAGVATFQTWCRLGARADGASLINVAKGMSEFDVRARLGEVAQPTLVIAGGQDKLFPPEQAREVADGIVDARFEVIAEASHISCLDSADRFNTLLLDFLHAHV